MRWIATSLVLGLFGIAVYYFAIRDRNFRSYGGAELGMKIATALGQLQRNGYVVVYGSPPIKSAGCSGADKYTLVYGRDPTYSVTISPDSNCNVAAISRKLRGMEL